MSNDQLLGLTLLYSLVFTAIGYLLGQWQARRRLYRLQAKANRLRRAVAQLRRRLNEQLFLAPMPLTRDTRTMVEHAD